MRYFAGCMSISIFEPLSNSLIWKLVISQTYLVKFFFKLSKLSFSNRALKNKKVGIDVSVPSYETASSPKLVKDYHVVVITRLPHFKLPEHSEEDVVQFMVRHWDHNYRYLTLQKSHDYVEVRTLLSWSHL